MLCCILTRTVRLGWERMLNMKRTKIINGQVITPYRIFLPWNRGNIGREITYVGEQESGLPCRSH